MRVPSGIEFTVSDIHMIVLLEEAGSIESLEQPTTLNSGIKSHVYVRMRNEFTELPDLQREVGMNIAQVVFAKAKELGERRDPVLIGVPAAGTALAQAASMMSPEVARAGMKEVSPAKVSQEPLLRRIGFRTMREKRKDHGVHKRWVDGEPDPNHHWYWVVENTITTGKAILENAVRLAEDGYRAKEMPHFIWIDRQQGGVEKLIDEGFTNIIVRYRLRDIAYALWQLKLWPERAYREVEEEIVQSHLLR